MTTPASQPAGPSTAAPALTPDQLSQVLSSVKDCLRDEMQFIEERASSREGGSR